MYAIIQTGGKQYRVEKGDKIQVELLAPQGVNVRFNDVVFFKDGNLIYIGAPYVTQYYVEGELVGEEKGPKVVSFKYKRRKNYRRKVGHRQRYFSVKIVDIKKREEYGS